MNCDELLYRQEIVKVKTWCGNNKLLLNASKTKELIFDFSLRSTCDYPVFIDGKSVEIVKKYKYLGVLIDDKLKWSENVNALYSKGQQRLFFVRRLKSFHIDKELLSLFYYSVVQSVILNCSICWWSCLTIKDRNKLEYVRKVASRIIGLSLPTLESVYCSKACDKVTAIVKGNNVLSHCVSWLKSGRRLQSLKCRTNR